MARRKKQMRFSPKDLMVFWLVTVFGCGDLVGVGDLSSTANAGAPIAGDSGVRVVQAGSDGNSPQGIAGFVGYSTQNTDGNTSGSTAGAAGFGGTSIHIGGATSNGGEEFGGAQATGGNAATGNAGFGGSSIHFGGAIEDGSGGTQATGGSSTLGIAGSGGSSIQITGGNTFGTTAGVAGSGGDSIPNTQGSGGNSVQGGESTSGTAGFAGNSTGGTAGFAGDSTNGGTTGAEGHVAGGSAGRGGSVTVYSLADYLLSSDPDTSAGVWRLRSMRRIPLARNLQLTALEQINQLDPQGTPSAGLRIWGDSQPSVVANLNYTLYKGVSFTLPPRAVLAHPGEFGEYAEIAWIAPAAGLVDIVAEFLGIDCVVGTTTDVHILVKSLPPWTDDVTGCLDRAEHRWTSVPVQFGDLVAFAVGVGSDGKFVGDATELRATVTLTSP